jgi:hypothetical protein
LVRQKPFTRTFIEAGLPAWGMLVILMFLGRGNLSGNAGLLVLLTFIFPGAWGAIRLERSSGNWLKRLGVYLFFCAAQGAAIAFILLASLLFLRLLGLYSGVLEISVLVGRALVFGVIPGIAFAILRMLIALPKAMREWGARGCLWRGAGLAALLVVLGAGGYWLASRPYAGHTSQITPQVLKTSTITGFEQGAAGWQTANPSVSLQAEDGALHVSAVAPTLFYTVTWQMQPGDLPVADGFKVWAHSGSATTLTAEVEEAGGARYRSWVDLMPGELKTLYLTDFIPSLETPNNKSAPDWGKVDRVTFYVYLETPGSGLWLDKIEAVTLHPRGGKAWLEASSQHFWLRYHAADQRTVPDVLKSAESQYNQITGVLGYYPQGRVPITLVSTHAELEQQLGARRPTWVYGAALPDSLVMLTPLRFSPTFNGHRYDDIYILVPHELTHLILAQIVGYPGFREMPQWLNEGLAVYLSGQSGDEHAIVEAAKTGKLPSFAEVNKALAGQAPIGNSYDLAGSITGYMIDVYGADKIPHLLTALANGIDFENALIQTVGMDDPTLEKQWHEMLVLGD